MTWATAITALALLAFLVLAIAAIRRGKRDAVESAAREARAEDAARKAGEHEIVAEVERRDLPAGVAGGRVRDQVGGFKSGPPPGAGGA